MAKKIAKNPQLMAGEGIGGCAHGLSDVCANRCANPTVAESPSRKKSHRNFSDSSFGKPGSGLGKFDGPLGVALSRTGARCYVTEYNGNCVECWNRDEPAVAPASLGRVKALFR